MGGAELVAQERLAGPLLVAQLAVSRLFGVAYPLAWLATASAARRAASGSPR